MNSHTEDFGVINIAPVPAPAPAPAPAIPPYSNNGLFDGYDNDATVEDDDFEEQTLVSAPKHAKKAAEPESKSVHVIAAHRRVVSAPVPAPAPVPVHKAADDDEEEEEPAAPAPAVQKKKQTQQKDEESDSEDAKPVAVTKKPQSVLNPAQKNKQPAKAPAPALASVPVQPVQAPAVEKPKPKEPAMSTQPAKPQTEEPAAKRTKLTIEPEIIESLVDERVQASEKRLKSTVEEVVAAQVRQEMRALLAMMAASFDGNISLPAETAKAELKPAPALAVTTVVTADKKKSATPAAVTGTKRPAEPAAVAPITEPEEKAEKKVTPEVAGPVIPAFEVEDELIENALRLMTEKVNEYLAKGTLKQVIEQTGRKLTGFLLNNGHLKIEKEKDIEKDNEKYSKLAMSRWRTVCEFMHRMYPDEIEAFVPKRGLSRVEIAMKYCKEHTIGTKRTRVTAVVKAGYSQSVDYLAAGVAHIVASAREREQAEKKVEQQQPEGDEDDN